MKRYDVMEIPNGVSGRWEVDEFEVPENSLENLRISFKTPGREMPVGKYKRLCRDGSVVMSNTPAECRDHSYFIYKAHGKVLINGLGLGVVLSEILNKEEVTEVEVVENSKDVISLVWPYFGEDSRATLHQADALTFKPVKNKRYNAVWHDIWNNICSDNLKEMAILHRKYGRRTNWQGSWNKEICQYHRDRNTGY